MKNSFLLFVSVLLFAACDPYQYDANSAIELKKDPCFGFCPVYSFKVDGKGNATFQGERNVNKEGAWTRTLTPEQTNALFKAFEDANFWQFQDEYTAPVTDLPTTYVTFTHKGQSKTVKDYYGSPPELKNLEKLVEEIAETEEGWSRQAGK
jgi:hypothetical protein